MRFADFFLTSGCSLILGSSCQIVLDAWGVLTPGWQKILAYGGSFIFGLVLEVDFPRPYAFMLAKRGWVVFIFCCVLTAISFFLLFMMPNFTLWDLLNDAISIQNNWSDTLAAGRSLASGIVFGVILRTVLNSNFLLSPQPGSLDASKKQLVLVLAALVFLTPLPPARVLFLIFYLVGIGLGFFLHFMIRTTRRDYAHRAQRMRDAVERTRSDEQNRIYTPDEKRAIEYYADGKFKELKKLLKEANRSTTLVIINACMLRLQKEHQHALNALGAELGEKNRTDTLDSKLHCLRALCYSERGEHPAMWTSLNNALDITPKCVLTNLTYGLRLAEEIKSANHNHPTVGHNFPRRDKTPGEYVQGAMRTNLELSSIPNGFSAEEEIVGYSIPLTWNFLEDTLAYVLLTNGDMKLSRTLLTSCIHNDPSLSSPYLHLGEWFMERRRLDGQLPPGQQSPTARQTEMVRLAYIAFYVAKYLEGKEDSHIKRRVIACLNQLDQMQKTVTPLGVVKKLLRFLRKFFS